MKKGLCEKYVIERIEKLEAQNKELTIINQDLMRRLNEKTLRTVFDKAQAFDVLTRRYNIWYDAKGDVICIENGIWKGQPIDCDFFIVKQALKE